MHRTVNRILALLSVFVIALSMVTVASAETLAFPTGSTALNKHHDGDPEIDFVVAYNSDCKASLAGTVVRIGTGCKNRDGKSTGKNCLAVGCPPHPELGDNGYCGWGYGNYVILQHPNNIYTVYAHLAAVDVAVGQSVAKGQRVGPVGSTGSSYTPHVHFELYFGKYGPAYKVDPKPYFSKDLPTDIASPDPVRASLTSIAQVELQGLSQTDATILVTFNQPYLVKSSTMALSSGTVAFPRADQALGTTVSQLRYQVKDLFGACTADTLYQFGLYITIGNATYSFVNLFKTLAVGEEAVTLRGDADANGRVNIDDLASIVDYLVENTPCNSMANANLDGYPGVSIMDAVFLAHLLVN